MIYFLKTGYIVYDNYEHHILQEWPQCFIKSTKKGCNLHQECKSEKYKTL